MGGRPLTFARESVGSAPGAVLGAFCFPGLLGFALCFFSCGGLVDVPRISASFQRGMTIFFYGRERNTFERSDFTSNLRELRAAGVTMIVLAPYGFQTDAGAESITRDGSKSITDSDFVQACSLVTAEGFSLCVKPHLTVQDGSERSTISPRDVNAWTRSYLKFLLHYARIGTTHGARVLCIGTELTGLSSRREVWEEIVDSCRNVFPGQITYSACPQEALSIAFWESLDLIGINAYFPLSLKENPEYEELIVAWGTWRRLLRDLSLKFSKEIVITEIGYMNHHLAARDPGRWSRKGILDHRLQADCYRAALESAGEMGFVRGMWWWQWELNGRCGGDTIDYTPRNKPAIVVLREFWR